MMSGLRSRKTHACVIIPAYNEQQNITRVIQEIQLHQPSLDIVVIDDGSSDQTAKYAAAEGVRVIQHTHNMGIGGAMRSGLQFADQNKYDFAVQIDADGQHDPASLSSLLAAAEQGADLVIGSRFLQRTSYPGTFLRWFGNRVFSLCIWLVTRRWITDSTSGYRIFNKRVLPVLASAYSSDFPEPESIVLLLKNSYQVREVSVVMRARQSGSSSIGIVQSMYLMLAIPLRIFQLSFKV